MSEEDTKMEINIRLFYALGDISPKSAKMKRAVESIYELFYRLKEGDLKK